MKDEQTDERMKRVGQINSRVADVPAQIVVCEGKLTVVGESQGYPVNISPGLGVKTGVEVIRHAVGTGDPGKVEK